VKTVPPVMIVVSLVLGACTLGGESPAPPPRTALPTPAGNTAGAPTAPVPPTRAPATGVSAPPPTPPAGRPATRTAPATLVAAPPAASTGPTPPSLVPDLAPGWTKITPGGATTCSRDTPYAFWVHPGTVNRLLVNFAGGGGCWNAATCRPGSTFFDDAVTDRDNPIYQDGIFDLANPANPFQDYYIVHVPYCTGDVHWGNNVHTYEDRAGPVTIHHKGFANASVVLSWVYAHFAAPEAIFVTGCSAGSIGSILFAPYLIHHYPQARVTQLGDSEAYVFHRPVDLQSEWRAHDNFPAWIPGMREILPGRFTMSQFYATVARFYPDYIFSQYNTAHDAVQQRYFYAVIEGTPTPLAWEDALDASLREIHALASNFRSYVAGGADHCITPRAEFYTRQVDGRLFRDWVAALAAGAAVPSIHCTICEIPEYRPR
jgi:hypothetical protein